MTYKEQLAKKEGYIRANMHIIRQALENIKGETEYDIWFPAWDKIESSIEQMDRMLNNGGIR